MKATTSNRFKLIAVALFNSFLFIQAGAQCTAYWYCMISTSDPCKASFKDASVDANAWNWTFGDAQTSTLQNPVHTYSASGTYSVCLTITVPTPSGNCTNTLCKLITVQCGATGISDLPDEQSIAVYPNPSNGMVNLKINEFEDFKIEVYDTYGQKIYNDINHFQINLSSHSNGVYFIKIGTEKEYYTQKIILQK